MTIALDATYSVGRQLSGVGVYSRNILFGLARAHAGDFGNLMVGRNGTGSRTITMPGLTLTSGRYAVVGKAFILHAKADDLTTQPSGNAGDRIACGVIALSE